MGNMEKSMLEVMAPMMQMHVAELLFTMTGTQPRQLSLSHYFATLNDADAAALQLAIDNLKKDGEPQEEKKRLKRELLELQLQSKEGVEAFVAQQIADGEPYASAADFATAADHMINARNSTAHQVKWANGVLKWKEVALKVEKLRGQFARHPELVPLLHFEWLVVKWAEVLMPPITVHMREVPLDNNN